MYTCVNVHFFYKISDIHVTVFRVETFFDIQLNIKGKKNGKKPSMGPLYI